MYKAYDEIEKKGYQGRDPVEKAIYALHHVSKSHRDLAEVAAEAYAALGADIDDKIETALMASNAFTDMYEKYEALKAELARKDAVIEASKIIYKVTSLAFSRSLMLECPHGISPQYPTHAWWCDKCWGKLKDTLDELDALKGAQE